MPAVGGHHSPNSLTCSRHERVTKLLLLPHPCFGFPTEPVRLVMCDPLGRIHDDPPHVNFMKRALKSPQEPLTPQIVSARIKGASMCSSLDRPIATAVEIKLVSSRAIEDAAIRGVRSRTYKSLQAGASEKTPRPETFFQKRSSGQASAGRLSNASAVSSAWLARITRGSAKRGPTSWRPIGRPAVDSPQGSEAAGCPVRLKGTV